MKRVIESPCVDVCQLAKGDTICRGCYRTLDEIANWSAMTDVMRRSVMRELRARKTDNLAKAERDE